MAGLDRLDPAISQPLACLSTREQDRQMQTGGWVYLITNRRYGTLYVGVASDIARRAWEHREGIVEGFTRRYGLKLLVFAEHHDEIVSAIQREKNIKHWPRRWKIDLIEAQNPEWEDLYHLLPE